MRDESIREAWKGEEDSLPYLLIVNASVRYVRPHWHEDLELINVPSYKALGLSYAWFIEIFELSKSSLILSVPWSMIVRAL